MSDYITYDRDWLVDLFRRGKMPKQVYFWGHKSQNKTEVTKACFSQWWPSVFEVDGHVYSSAEHWMMAEKARLFKSETILKRILATKKPGAAKALGRQIETFDQLVWDTQKYDIVVKGNIYKFSQNLALKEFLINTKSRVLIEASPVDKVWGIGLSQEDPHCGNPLKWKGKNLLGFALMSARGVIQS